MTDLEYWKECIATAADELPLTLLDDELTALAKAVSSGHEYYGMSFYSPPTSDRYREIEREWRAKYTAIEKELEQYKRGAEKAIKLALSDRVSLDSNVSINERGEVFEHGGRTTQIL